MFIYLLHLIIHPWTNTLASGEKIIGQIHFSRNIFFGSYFSILVREGEGLYVTDRG